MLGTLVNAGAVVLGSLIGILINKGIKDSYREIVMDGLALVVMLIGIMGSIKSEDIMLVIISLVVGSLLGEAIGIEKKLDNLGNKLESKFGGGNGTFAKGFVTTSLLFCVGAMAIVGALESGIQGNHQTLYAKSVIDGFSSIIFASTMGIGVAFSSVAILIYQGGIAMLASLVKDFLTPEVINEMSAIGSLLIVAISINMLGIKKIKVGNMLPAVFIPIIYYSLVNIINFAR